MYLILQTLLTLIHIIYKLISFIHYYYSFVSLKVKTQIWNRCLLRTTDLCILKKNSRFKKIPNHLVIIINEEKQTIQNIHQLLNWSTAIGIPYISFYDCQGYAKDTQDVTQILFDSKIDCIQCINWNEFEKTGANIEGTWSKSKILWLSSHFTGKAGIVQGTKTLASKILHSNNIKLDDHILDDTFALQGIPSPDVALICGTTCSTYGLLPWQIRTTEFLISPFVLDHFNSSVNNFVELLSKYNRREQRYGQ